MFDDGSLHARHFTNSVNSHSSSRCGLSSSFYRGRSQVSDLPKVTQVVRDGIGIQIQADLLRCLCVHSLEERSHTAPCNPRCSMRPWMWISRDDQKEEVLLRYPTLDLPPIWGCYTHGYFVC